MLKRKQMMQAAAAATLVISTTLGGSAILAQGNGNGAGQAQQQGTRAFLGISLENSADGVRVAHVLAGSPAEAAGLQVGDILTAINGTDIATPRDARDIMVGLAVGDTISLSFTRDGESQTADATLTEAAGRGFRAGRGERGMHLLEQAGGMSLEYDQQSDSWTVSELAEDSPLYAAGLRAGDVLTTVNGEAFSPRALLGALLTATDQAADIALGITREGDAQELTVSAQDLMQFGMLSMLPGMDFAAPFGRGEGGMGRPGGMGERGDRFGMMLGRGGQLGLAFEPIDANVASANDLSVNEGALVREVIAGSPAETAGLQVGDVITAVNGEAVNEEWTLRDRVQAYEPGDVITLDVLRSGATQQIQVTLSEPIALSMGLDGLPDQQMLEQLLQHMQQGQPSTPLIPDGQPGI